MRTEKEARGAPEWLRDLRGLPAYALCFWTPLWRTNDDTILGRLFLWLLPYAGDWMFRDERRSYYASQDTANG